MEMAAGITRAIPPHPHPHFPIPDKAEAGSAVSACIRPGTWARLGTGRSHKDECYVAGQSRGAVFSAVSLTTTHNITKHK